MSFRTMILSQDPTVVQFIGAMTEDADLSMLRVASGEALEIELSQLTSINSVGIRELRAWSGTLNNRQIRVTFAPKCFIDQVNMIPELIPKWSVIESFYVPYYSEESGEETRVLFTRGKEFDVEGGQLKLEPPAVPDSQGGQMEPDVILDSYFGFLTRQS